MSLTTAARPRGFYSTQPQAPVGCVIKTQVKSQNSYGKNFREAQAVDLQDGCSEIEAVCQVRQEIVHGGQEWRGRPRRQSGPAHRGRKSQAGKRPQPCDRK